MAAVYQVPGSGAVEFENDGELEQVLSFGIVEAQAGGAPPAGPYQGISFVGMPVSWFALAISLLVVL